MNILAGPILFIRAVILLLGSGKLIKLSFIPGVVSCISTIGIYVLLDQNFEWIAQFIPGLLALTQNFGVFGSLISGILTLLLAPFVVMLLALPLCEPIAAEIDCQQGGEEVEQGFIQGIISGLMFSIKLILLGLSVSLVLTATAIIPVIGLFTGLFNLCVWTPLIVSLDTTDFVFGRRAYSLSQRFKILLKRPLNTISIGLLSAPLLATPFLNLIGAPIVVIMGTLYARQLETDLGDK